MKIKKVIDYFSIEDRNLSLEHRLFLSSIMVGLVISIIGTVVAYILSLSVITVFISLILSCLLLVIYYFARFKGIIKPFILPIIIAAFIGIFSTWLLAGGINGPNILPASLILIFSLLIVPAKFRPYIFSLFLACVFIVYLLQYFNPEIIIDYPTETSRWIDSFVTAIYCSVCIYLIISFIHKHYTIERLRAEKNETYNVITNQLKDWVSLTDLDGNFVSANPAISEMTGYSETELLKMSVSNLESKSQSQLQRYIPEKKANTVGIPYLKRIKRKDETEFIAEIVTSRITISGQNFFLSTGKDITEQKLVEEALRESEAVYRTLVDRLPDGVYKSTHDGKFVDVNPAMVSMLGYASKEELLAVDIKTQLYFEPGDRESLVLEEKLKEIGIYQLKKKDGTGIWVEDHGWYDLGDNGEILFHEGISRDITARRKAELERQVIYEISQGAATTNNLSELLKLIHQSLGKVLYADNCFVALHDQNTGRFSFPYYTDQFDTTPEPVEMPKSCTAYVFRTGIPLLITPELFKQLKEQNEVELVGSPSPSWIGVPLKTPDGTIGVLVLQHYEKENVYSEQDIQFLDSVGSQIALAIKRKQAEEELRESETELEVILQSTADGILAIDGNGKVIKTNKRFAELWLIPQELIDSGDDDSLLNFAIGQLTNPTEFISKVQKLYHSTDEDMDQLHFRDGRIFERFSAPLIMPDSSIGRVWSFRDITERKFAEDALRDSAQQFRSVLETVSLIGLMLDTEGRITLCNDFLLELTGWQREELLQQNCFDMFLPPEIRKDILVEVFLKSISDGIIAEHYENEIIARNGKRRLIAWSNTILHDHRGVVSGVASIGEDITDSKLAQAEIKHQNEQLQKINAEKDKFFSIIAHDLRSPFNGFLGLTKMMVEELPELTTDQIQKFAVSLQKSATNLYRLLENLLEWSQLQKGEVRFNPELIPLGLVVDESIVIIQLPAKNKHIEISVDIPDSLVAFADNYMLQAVMRNLVSNAVKFTTKGGKVCISAKTIDDNRIEISIEDTGIGMNQILVENLFRIDVQSGRKGTEGEPSSGLGLLLCKEFIEKNGGKIWVESKVGKGSTFYFTLPGNPASEEKLIFGNDAPSDIQDNKNRPKVPGLKILIAEDDETSEMLIAISVKTFTKEILVARTGIEAVDAVRINPDIDLVLMDINMPKMGGYEATRLIREFNKDVIIIAQTAFALPGDKEKAIVAGCNDHISKPINKDELVGLVQKYFKK